MKILGVKIDNLSLNEVLERVEGFLKDGKSHYIVTSNPEFLVKAHKDKEFSELTIPESTKSVFMRVCLECRQTLKLREYGLKPCNKLFLYGQKGTGKEASAHALANKMNLPMFKVDLNVFFYKYSGEIYEKLSQIYDQMMSVQAVYFFENTDEIESLLIEGLFEDFFKLDNEGSFVIASSNYLPHRRSSSRRIYRIFDYVIKYSLPEGIEIKHIIENRLWKFKTKDLDFNSIQKSAKGLSPAEINFCCDEAAKIAVLNGITSVTSEDIIHGMKLKNDI